MKNQRNNFVGYDRDDGSGVLALIIIVLMVVAAIIAFFVFCGAFVGGGFSLYNYFKSFKHNVYDSNKAIAQTA